MFQNYFNLISNVKQQLQSCTFQKVQQEMKQVLAQLEQNKAKYLDFIKVMEKGMKTFELRMNNFSYDSIISFKAYSKEMREISDKLEQIKTNSFNASNRIKLAISEKDEQLISQLRKSCLNIDQLADDSLIIEKKM